MRRDPVISKTGAGFTNSALSIMSILNCNERSFQIFIFLLAKRPFQVTHSVYSAISLNVKLTVEKNLFYPAKDIWEDIHFNLLCLQAGFPVAKFNRFFHKKINFTKEPKHTDTESDNADEMDLVRSCCDLTEITQRNSQITWLPEASPQSVPHLEHLEQFLCVNRIKRITYSLSPNTRNPIIYSGFFLL